MEEIKSVTWVGHMLRISCKTSSVSVEKKNHFNNYINIDGPGHIIFKLFFLISTLLYRMTGIIKINTLILTVAI